MEEELIFHDITEGSAFPIQSFEPFGWVLIGLVVLSFLFLLISMIRKKQISERPQRTLVQNALLKIHSEEESLLQEQMPQTASRLSLLIREALPEVKHWESLYQSQQEFHISNTDHLPDRLIAHLNDLWSIQYKPSSTGSKQSQDLIRETKKVLQSLIKPSTRKSTS